MSSFPIVFNFSEWGTQMELTFRPRQETYLEGKNISSLSTVLSLWLMSKIPEIHCLTKRPKLSFDKAQRRCIQSYAQRFIKEKFADFLPQGDVGQKKTGKTLSD